MKTIDWKKTALGIELGSTRIKATIIDSDFNVVAEGQSEWENRYENKFWTYSLEDIHSKLLWWSNDDPCGSIIPRSCFR